MDHPGRVTLKTEELFCFVLFCCFLSSTIESREGRVILRLVSYVFVIIIIKCNRHYYGELEAVLSFKTLFSSMLVVFAYIFSENSKVFLVTLKCNGSRLASYENHLPVSSSSCEVVFVCGHLPVSLFSCEVIFL